MVITTTLWKYLAVAEDQPLNPDCASPPADWIRERLSAPEKSVVTSWVPGGFDAYVRILHPVQMPRGDDPLVRWDDVSKWGGVTLHPHVQWHEVALPEVDPPNDPPWRGQGPHRGSLYLPDAEALVEDLARYTPRSQECYFCVWCGWGGGVTLKPPSGSGTLALARRPSPTSVVELPWREYELFEGPLTGALGFEQSVGNSYQSPNLWWPTDRSWCVASEIDLPWTYVGGSKELIDQLLADGRLETVGAAPEDSLWREFPAWLLERIKAAAEEVVLVGSTVLTLAAGTVEVSLEPLGKRGRAHLVARSTRPSGGWAGGTSPVNTRRSDELRRDVRTELHRAVRALVEV